MIKSILFDLDGTLRHSTPTGDEVALKYLIDNGWKISEEAATRAERWEHYYFANSPEIRSDFDVYKEREAFWINFSRRRLVALGLHLKDAQELAPTVSAHMAENYRPQPHVPQEAFTLLTSLKESGYILGVVSNREHTFQDELQELKLDTFFNFTLAGGEVKSYKPDKAIFDHAVGMAGNAASESIYVGDNYFADILGSHRAGLMPVLYDPKGLFPEADCAIIKSFHEMHALLKTNM